MSEWMRLSGYPSEQDFIGQIKVFGQQIPFIGKEVTSKLIRIVPTLLCLRVLNKSGLAPHRGFTSHCRPKLPHYNTFCNKRFPFRLPLSFSSLCGLVYLTVRWFTQTVPCDFPWCLCIVFRPKCWPVLWTEKLVYQCNLAGRTHESLFLRLSFVSSPSLNVIWPECCQVFTSSESPDDPLTATQ